MRREKRERSKERAKAKHRQPGRRWPRRALWITGGVCLAGLCGAVIINIIMVQSTKPYLLTMEEAQQKRVDCIMVLGALVYGDKGLSPMLEDRVTTGMQLYNGGASDRLMMSGDHGREDYDEVNHMKDYAVDHGIPAETVFMDHAGFSTYESMARARDVFEVQSVIICTQAYHLPRAIYLARSLGLEAYGVAADRRDYGNEVYNETREFLARIKAFGSAIFQPKPTYLGEAIPISGRGTLTDDR